MFLRKTSRFKDGKVHDYWSVAENSRAGRRVVLSQLGLRLPPQPPPKIDGKTIEEGLL